MISRRAALAGGLAAAGTLANLEAAHARRRRVTPRFAEGRALIFNDEFAGDTLRPVWQTRGTEFTDESPLAKAAASRANVADGRLVLDAVRWNNGTYRTGHVGTGEVLGEQRFTFTYGYAEATMRFHGLPGMHAAFWLQTTEAYVDGQAEVDVAECFGRDPVWHNLYWREGNPLGAMQSHKQASALVDPAGGLNRYGVLWEPGGYTFTINDTVVARSTAGLSDRPKFLVLSLLCKDFEQDKVRTDRIRDYAVSVARVAVWQ